MQHRIGLTGGIASGKSTVADYLKDLGMAVLDADTYSHEALQPGTLASQMVLERYGSQVEAELECDIEQYWRQRGQILQACHQYILRDRVQ